MNDLNTAIFWGVLQATAFLLVALVIYAIARRLSPRVGAMSALTTLLVLVAIAPMSLSSWPSWNFRAVASPASSLSPTAAPAPSDVDFESAQEDDISPVTTADHVQASQSATIFWQTLKLQMTRIQNASPAARPPWTRWLAPAFAIGFSLAASWRLLGWFAVRRQVADSKPISEPEILEMLDVLQAQMSIPGRVELSESQELTSAATVGWRVPRILLPRAWRDWTETERHVVLAHELAHIARRDYLTWIIAQSGVLLHFYHPLAHWFARRLRLEQELAADSMAASLVGGRELYLSTLGNLALRTPSDSLAWPAQAFLPVRSTFLRRIEMLRQPKSLLESRWASSGGPASIACLLLLAVFVCGIRLPSAAVAQESAVEKEATSSGKMMPIAPSMFPADVALLVQFQPSGLLANPKIKSSLAEFAKEIREESGLKLEDIESVWMAGKPPTIGARDDFFVTVARTKTPHSLTTVHGEIIPASKERAPFISMDDQTLVFGEELDRYLAGTKRPHLPPTWWKRWSKVKSQTGRAVVDVQVLRRTIPDAPELDALVGPILSTTRDVMLSFDLEDQTKLAARFSTGDEESAERVRKNLEALMNLGENLLERQAGMIGTAPDEVRPVLKSMFDLAGELLASAKIKTKGKNVDVRSRAKGEGGVVAIAAALPAIQSARTSARRVQSMNNIKQLALGLLNYESAYGHFPGASMKETGSKHPHSWRVAILPFIGRKDLYDKYNFDEPWNSDANKKLIPLIPDMLKHPEDTRKGMASYFVAVGAGTIFSDDDGVSVRDVTDGMSKTLMVLEAKRDIPWTKPEDIADDVKPNELGWEADKFLASRADGSVQAYSHDTDVEVLQSMLDKADGR